MTRTVSSTISSAIEGSATRPIYLIELGFAATSRVATWDQAISYGGNAYAASGVQISNLSASGCNMVMPTGDSDPWLALVLGEGTRGRTVTIYEHHYDATASPTSDAVLVFTGYMDAARITDKITVNVVEASRAKSFPHYTVDETVFTHLLSSGDRITWGPNIITVS